MNGYCTVTGKWNGDGWVEHPATFDDLVALLKQVRERFIDEYADAQCEDDELRKTNLAVAAGGYGVQASNRWGSIVEVAAGRDAWFLFRIEPSPGRCHSDRPPIKGTRLFFIDGGHYTECDAEDLVSREECLRVLKEWLNNNSFPTPARE